MQDLLCAAVGRGDEVRRALQRYLQMLNLAEVAFERARRFACGLDHDVEEGRTEHGGSSARRGTLRQGRGSCAACSASIHGFAAFSPAARVSGSCLSTNSSSFRSVAPAALETRCHLIDPVEAIK